MTRQIETRLVDTLAAMADQVTNETLTLLTLDANGQPTFTEGTGPNHDHLVLDPDQASIHPMQFRRSAPRWIGPLLVAATVAALVVGGATLAKVAAEKDDSPANHTSGPMTSATRVSNPSATRVSPQPSSTSSLNPTSTPVAAMLPNGKEASWQEIPWSQVSSGWTVAKWTATVDLYGPATLYLVNPVGGRYNLGSLPAGASILDWSPDGRRVLLAEQNSTVVFERNLETGKDRSIPLPPPAQGAVYNHFTYTRPRGTAFVITFGHNDSHGYLTTTTTMEKFGTDGTHQVTYPASTPTAGDLGGEPLYAPDGLTLIVSAAKGVVVLGNGGEVLRLLPNPAGYSTCYPRGWWADGVATVGCVSTANGSVTNVFLMPLTGGPTTQLTKTPLSGLAGLGAFGAQQVDTGTFALKAQGCGGFTAAMVDPNGQLTDLALPTPPGAAGKWELIGSTHSSLYGIARGISACNGAPVGRSLVSYNFKSAQGVALLGPGVNGGSVASAIPFVDARFP